MDKGYGASRCGPDTVHPSFSGRHDKRPAASDDSGYVRAAKDLARRRDKFFRKQRGQRPKRDDDNDAPAFRVHFLPYARRPGSLLADQHAANDRRAAHDSTKTFS